MLFLSRLVIDSWYQQGVSWTRCLWPLHWLFRTLACRRKSRFLQKSRWISPVPVVVVGNITVGGTGKTPVTGALVRALQLKGYCPGIVSSGFGVKEGRFPASVTPDSIPSEVGDEPVMLARQVQVPLVVDPDRVQAAQYLLEHFDCDLIIADDGLQHYNLQRDVEILVLDGERMLGNELCLPAGPLREPPERMQSVDVLLVNGDVRPNRPVKGLAAELQNFYLKPDQLMPVGEASSAVAPVTGKVHGVAGIGNPQRFFNTLTALGYEVIPHPYPDHHAFTPEDIEFGDTLPVLMTAKDAVKCRTFAGQRHWYLPVTTDLPEGALAQVVHLIETFRNRRDDG